MNNKITHRVEFIDGIKFFVMFLVIMGHMIQDGSYHLVDTDWKEDGMFLFIYSFHMPLFLFLSGMFLGGSIKLPPPDFLKKKLFQLLLPAYSWRIFVAIICLISGYILGEKVKYPISWISPYWFLTLLFLSYSIGYVIVRYSNGRWLYFNILLATIGVVFLPKVELSHINAFFIFFMSGYLLKDYILSDSHKFIDGVLLVLSLILFVILYQYWKIDYTVYFSPVDSSCINKPDILLVALYRFMLAFSGCLVIVLTFKKFKFLYDHKCVKMLGQHTLGVYLFQTPATLLIGALIPVNIESHLIRDFVVLPLFSIGIYLLAVYIELVICKSKILGFCFYGKTKK